MSLTKQMQDVYTGSNKASLKEMNKDLNKWKNFLESWMERDIVQVAILSKLIYRLHTIPIKISEAFFAEVNGQADPKTYVEILGGTQNNQRNLEK